MAAPLTATRHNQTCEICMEDDKPFLMSQSCWHLICVSCQDSLHRAQETPALCPFCRKPLGFQRERFYKGEITCHTCRMLKDSDEIGWCEKCRILLCSNCQKEHWASNRSNGVHHDVYGFARYGKSKAANAAIAHHESKSNAAYREDRENYTHHLEYFLGPMVQKMSKDAAEARIKHSQTLHNNLECSFHTNGGLPTYKNRLHQGKALPTDDGFFEQLMKFAGLDITPPPLSLSSQSSYFVAAEANASTIKILVESLKLSHFNIVDNFFTIGKQNKVFYGKLPNLPPLTQAKIPTLKLLYEFKEQAGDLESFEIDNRFALYTYGEDRLTFAVLTEHKSDFPENNQWKLTISEIEDPQSTVHKFHEISKNRDLTDIGPTDSKLGTVIGMRIYAPRQENATYYHSQEIFYILVNCENGSEVLEISYDPVSGWKKDYPFRSIYQTSDKVKLFSILQDGYDNELLHMAVVYSGAEEKVVKFKVKDTASVSGLFSTVSFDVNAQDPSSTRSFTFTGAIKSIDFGAGPGIDFGAGPRLVVRTEDGDVFFMQDSKEPATKPLKRLSIDDNAKLSPYRQENYVILDEETGIMHMVDLI